MTQASPIREARERIAATLATFAEHALGTPASGPDAGASAEALERKAKTLKLVAEAAGAVTGPQGGDLTSSTSSDTTTTTITGDPTRPAGFTAPVG